MPDPRQFLEGFDLVPGNKFGGYILRDATSTHKAVTRWQEYKYNIVLSFQNLGRGVYDNLYNALMDEIEQAHIIYGVKNPYRCTIDAPIEGSVIDDHGTIIFNLIGHAHRIYQSQL
jgi:hypothetical protein